jgi:hypothetical protein
MEQNDQTADPQPSIEEKGITTIRLHRLHFSSKPCPHTLAINCPHAQRVSRVEHGSREEVFATAMVFSVSPSMKLRTIINILISLSLSRRNFSQAGLREPHKISYNFPVTMKLAMVQFMFLVTVVVGLWGCVTRLPAVIDPQDVTEGLVIGRVVTVLNGDRSRRFSPAVRFVEVEDQASHKQFQVEINSPDRHFAAHLPSGQYRLTRVQITEGPFMSMADVTMTFPVDATAITYVGTWRFGVDSPRYGRMMVVSVVADQAETVQAQDFLDGRYPMFKGSSMAETLPQPIQIEARLYEIMPYPRYPRYFRRYWW